MRAPLLLAVLLLAGCGGPDAPGLPQEAPLTPAPAPTYDVTVVVTQERPDGAPLAAEVQAAPLREDGTLGPATTRRTDGEGAVRFTFQQPTTLLVRAATEGWTKEGARIHVASAVAAEGLTVSDRDVFLPLYRDTLVHAVTHRWTTVLGDPRPDGTPALATVPVTFPEGLAGAYLARLADASVEARWMDTLQGRVATASAGLAWDGVAWVEGPAAGPAPGGEGKAVWDGELPAEGWPADPGAATLEAALFTRTAVVGEVLFDVTTTLRFGGRGPAELAELDCHLLC